MPSGPRTLRLIHGQERSFGFSPGRSILSVVQRTKVWLHIYHYESLSHWLGAKFAIFDKTISKTHLTVEVDHVEPGDCVRTVRTIWVRILIRSKQNSRKRSRVVLEDLGSKIGTLVNDEQIRGTRYELQKDYNEIKLGRHKYLFKYGFCIYGEPDPNFDIESLGSR